MYIFLLNLLYYIMLISGGLRGKIKEKRIRKKEIKKKVYNDILLLCL